jgi:hypothetical protein
VLLRCPVASATCPQELICDCPSQFAREGPREGRQQVSGRSGICGFVTVMTVRERHCPVEAPLKHPTLGRRRSIHPRRQEEPRTT